MKALAPAFEKLGGSLAIGFADAFASVSEEWAKMAAKMRLPDQEGESINPIGERILLGYDSTFTSVGDSFGAMTDGISGAGSEMTSGMSSSLEGMTSEVDSSVSSTMASVSEAGIISAQLASDAMSNISGPDLDLDPGSLVTYEEAALRIGKAMQFSPELEITAQDLMFPTPDNAAAIAALGEIEEQMSALAPEPISPEIDIPEELQAPTLDTSSIIADLMETNTEFQQLVEESGVSASFLTSMWEEIDLPGLDTSALSESLSGIQDDVASPLSAANEMLMTMAESGNTEPLMAKIEALKESAMSATPQIANASMGALASLQDAVVERGVTIPPVDFTELETSITSTKGAITAVVDDMSSSTASSLSGISDIDVSPGTDGIVNLTDQTTSLLNAAESLIPGFTNAGESMTDSLTTAVDTMPNLSDAMVNPDALLDTMSPAMDQVSAMADDRRSEISAIASEIDNVEIPGPGAQPIKAVEVDISSGMNAALESLSKLSDSIKVAQPEQTIDLKLNLMLDGGAIATIKKKLMASPAVGGRQLVVEDE